MKIGIAAITAVTFRHSTETVCVDWEDRYGNPGATYGAANNRHIRTLLNRARRDRALVTEIIEEAA